jgi:uncharacterized repeat protein (TIGR01451 family)
MRISRARSSNNLRAFPSATLRQNKSVVWRWLSLAAIASILLAPSCTTKGLSIFAQNSPDIEDVSPPSAVAGSSDTPLTITGVNFGKSSVPFLDGTLLPITSMTDTTIGTTFPASKLQQPGTHQITVGNLLPGNNLFSNSFPFVVTAGTPTPVLSPSKSHTGNFTQGQTGATYTAMVANTGSAPTDGSTVTLSEIPPPSGLTITSLNGGATWTCNNTMLTCTRNDALNGGASYPPVTVTVDVATNAPSTVTNEISVSGGGSSPATAEDPTTITSAGGGANLTLGIQSNSSLLTPGGTGIFTFTVGNNGTASTTGPVTVTTAFPSQLTIGSVMAGSAFTCVAGSAGPDCTSVANLAAGGTIQFTVTVNVATNATGSVTVDGVASAAGANSVTATTTVPIG